MLGVDAQPPDVDRSGSLRARRQGHAKRTSRARASLKPTAGRSAPRRSARATSASIYAARARAAAAARRSRASSSSCMSWQEGSSRSRSGSRRRRCRSTRASRISTESLLMEGARRIDEWSRIADKVPHLSVVPMLAPVGGRPARRVLDLLPHEWEVLTMIDGDARSARHRRSARARASSRSRRSRTGSCPPASWSCSRGSPCARRRRRRSAPSPRSSGRGRRSPAGDRRRRCRTRAPRSPRTRRRPRRDCSRRAGSTASHATPTRWTSCGAPCRAIRSRRGASRSRLRGRSRGGLRQRARELGALPAARAHGERLRPRACRARDADATHAPPGGPRRWLTTSAA